jgi:hypothetical protein
LIQIQFNIVCSGKTLAEEAYAMDGAPVLSRWFAAMDGSDPDSVLDLLSDDFRISVVFSKGANGEAADFSGDRAALERYLVQREKGVLVHELIAAFSEGHNEVVLGQTTRGGVFEATFLASVQLDGEGRVRRFFTGRSPGLAFTD